MLFFLLLIRTLQRGTSAVPARRKNSRTVAPHRNLHASRVAADDGSKLSPKGVAACVPAARQSLL